MTQPEGGGINAVDIYQQLARMSAKVDVILTRQEGSSAQIGDHEARLRVLERGRWPLASLSVLAAIAAVIVALVAAMTGK